MISKYSDSSPLATLKTSARSPLKDGIVKEEASEHERPSEKGDRPVSSRTFCSAKDSARNGSLKGQKKNIRTSMLKTQFAFGK